MDDDDGDDDDDDPDDDPDDVEELSYENLLSNVTEKWLTLELDHHTSKVASEAFWNLAKDLFPRLHKARIKDMVYKPIPKLRSQRKKLKKSMVPDIKLQTAYNKKKQMGWFYSRETRCPRAASLQMNMKNYLKWLLWR